jgi:hypothetical protein
VHEAVSAAEGGILGGAARCVGGRGMEATGERKGASSGARRASLYVEGDLVRGRGAEVPELSHPGTDLAAKAAMSAEGALGFAPPRESG